MSLNFFKHKSTKTDASLDFNTVVNALNTLDVTNGVLNVDNFIQSESVNLQRQQELFKEEETLINAPEKLEKEMNYTAKDVRLWVQTLSRISKTMPEAKRTATEQKNRVDSLISNNNQTIVDIQSMEKAFE